MGMTAVCSGGCGYSASSDSHRGGRLGTCPECGGQMRAHTAGKAQGRYRCPVTGWVFTLGLGGSIRLEEPMRLVFVPGWEAGGHEPDPARPGWTRQVHCQRTEPNRQEQEYLARVAGLVLGPGCAVSDDRFLLPGPNDRWHSRAAVRLVPAPDADPATWFVNEKLQYRKCAACPARVVAGDETRMPEAWTPRRAHYWRRRENPPTNPGRTRQERTRAATATRAGMTPSRSEAPI
jgi:hypothetical protein